MIKVEIAATPEKLSRGLMFREHLDKDAGMLFVFDRAQPLSFWGRNTFIPLDIAFIDRHSQVVEIGTIRKLSEAAVRSNKPCLMALEVNLGALDAMNVQIGDMLLIDKKDGDWVVSFNSTAESKTAQSKKAPKRHPILPFNQDSTIPIPDWMQDAQDAREPSPQPNNNQVTHNPFNQGDQEVKELPEIPIDQFVTADDEPDFGKEWEDDWDELDPADDEQQSQDETGDEETPPEDLPDASQMSNEEALKFAEDNGFVMNITYMIKPKRPKIGVMSPARTIQRRIAPHGIYHAYTTGNIIEVTWDYDVNDYRAFIIPQIVDKQFSGETFKKWFSVKDSEPPMSQNVPPPSDKIR